MRDAGDLCSSSWMTNGQLQNKESSMMQLFARAVSDCLDGEAVLLNDDTENDALLSGLRRLVSAECFEFREDIDEDYRRMDGGRSNGVGDDHLMMRLNNSPSRTRTRRRSHGQHNLAALAAMAERNDDDDDERSDFLVARNDGRLMIPDLVVFKPKKRRHIEGRQDFDERSNVSDFYFKCNCNSNRNNNQAKKNCNSNSSRNNNQANKKKKAKKISRW
eukprot:CAMPEP_0168193676 /NCGR_PEP_ID=MMETSP0139_2-20121125/18740_1 /TAXON_ID=44445 /ORGANISM="Pseudo-nitzschia australis, Strain 10249 10 AB" /LENGTH=217 /DNA_ID=CAMNT_0008117061 /DNA_START=348 /DNA_END=998 /DNA_ORIENTATION=-